MAHKCFSLLVPDDAFPDGRNKFKTSNPLLVIRGHLAAAFSRYTVPPPPNEGGGAAAEDAGEGCHKGPVGVIPYSVLESLILGAARFHSDCAALPIFMFVLTLDAVDAALGFLADSLAPDDTNLSGTRLKDLARTAFESVAFVLNKDHFQPGEPWAAKPKPKGKKGVAEGSEDDDEAGPSPRLLPLGVLLEPPSHPPKPRRSVLAYLVPAYFESGRARAADRGAGIGRKDPAAKFIRLLVSAALDPADYDEDDDPSEIVAEASRIASSHVPFDLYGGPASTSLEVYAELDFIRACQPRADKAARVGVLVTRIASAAERSGLVRIHTLFADMDSSAAGEAFGALQGAFAKDLPYSLATLQFLDSSLGRFLEELCRTPTERVGAILLKQKHDSDQAASRASVRLQDSQADAAAFASGGAVPRSIPEELIVAAQQAFDDYDLVVEAVPLDADASVLLYALLFVPHLSVLALSRKPVAKLSQAPPLALRAARLRGSFGRALIDLIPRAHFMPFDLSYSADGTASSPFAPGLLSVPLDAFPAAVLDLATVTAFVDFNLGGLSNHKIAVILASCVATVASTPVKLGLGGTLGSLPNIVDSGKTHLPGVLRCFAIDVMNPATGLPLVFAMVQRVLMEDEAPTAYGGPGPYAVDSVNGLFDSVLTSANERLQAALLDPAFYGLVALVLPGDAGSAKLAELSSELDANLAARRKSRKQTSNATGTHLPSIAATLTAALAGLVAGQRSPPSQAGRNGPAAALASSGNGGSGTSGGGSGGGSGASSGSSGASGGSSGASGGGKGGGKGGGAGPFVPLPRTAGVLVDSASVVPGPDRNLFRVPDSNLYNLGGATFHRAKLEGVLSDLGYNPGTYVVSTLLVADVNPSLDKLLRFAAPDAAGTQDIILPHERWYADKWVVSKGSPT